MNKKIALPIIIVAVLFAGWLGFGWWGGQNSDLLGRFDKSASDFTHLPSAELVTDMNVTFYIDNITPEVGWSLEVPKDFSVMAGLKYLDDKYEVLQMQTKTYEGLGDLVVSLGGVANGEDDKYWQYYVNGEMPLVGVDSYLMQSGDRVKWEFKEPVF